MCRIFGSWATVSSAQELQRVSARLLHGGPDDQTIARGDGWALGVNRLAVMNPAGGTQPYRLGPGIVAVFNGELYNHDDLRELLSARGREVADRCDGAVVPALYAEFGADFVDLLDGMFALAVADLRAEPRLLLACDRRGMKPLYHAWDGRTLHFASELPALLEFDGIDATVRDDALDEYLTTRTQFDDRTFYRGIRVLPPGGVALVGPGGLHLGRRADPPPPVQDCPDSLDDAGRRVRALLDAEVARLLVSDVPVCTIVSGGLDSSLVTALAARHQPGIDSFTIGYTGRWPHDERAHARAVADLAGTTHHEVEFAPAAFAELLPRVVEHLGQPNADPITVSSLVLFEQVRASGHTVALTGDAADEVFGGYDRMVAAAAHPIGDGWARPYVRSLSAVDHELRRQLYSTDYQDFLVGCPTVEDDLVHRLLAEGTDRAATLHAFETGVRMPAYHLRRVDHLSMAAAVEVRLPFCQASIVDASMQLPEWAKFGAHGRKRALYAAARGLVPEQVLTRPKQPFTLPIDAMLRPGRPLMDLACDVLSPGWVRADNHLSPDAVRQLLDARAHRPTASGALAVWALLIYALWSTRPSAGSLTGDGMAA